MTTSSVGRLGHRVITAPYEPSLATHRPTNRPFGLTEQAMYLYGGWREADGTLHCFERKFNGPMTAGLWLMRAAEGGIEIDPFSTQSVRGEVKRKYGDDEFVWHGQMMDTVGQAGPGYNFALRAGEFTWAEGDVLALTGSIVGPGVQIYAPDHEEAFLYVSELYRAKGTVHGEEVEGFVYIDHAYWPSGFDWKEYVVFNRLQLSWEAFANEYTDGSIEWGHICLGTEGSFSFTAVNNPDGPVSMDSRITGGVDLREDDWCQRHVWRTADGDAFAFEVEKDGQLSGFSNARGGGYRAQAGITQRVGDPREVKLGFTWLETFGDRIRENKVPSFDDAMNGG